MYQHVDSYPGDPILSLMDEFNKDTRENKINLSIGLYYDGEGKTPELKTVGHAKAELNKLPASASLYLPMEGLKDYRLEIQKLLFGADCPLIAQERIATVQTIGGSGALKLGADFLNHYFPKSEVWCSDPTWENHASIFSGAGTKVHYYPYFDEKSKGVKFAEMLATFKTLPENSIILMHPCCHNPTGSDLTPEQWDEVTKVAKAQKLIPFLDIAYQGFAEGIEEDAYAIRAMVKAGLPVFVSNSFSKIFGIYGERAGGLSVICESQEERDRVLGQLKAGVRRLYSSPPSNGAKIVAQVLTNSEQKAQWLKEVEEMRVRILEMRTVLVDELKKALPEKNFDHLLKQRGMFSYTGFSKEQVARLKDEFAVYLVGTGRVCMAGVNRHNVQRIVEAFAAVSK
ncbi:TPA: aromatic amino acid transaminase [Providencia stuartii]|uniref:Aminotransferase n=4 Tax=Enterobacterales TaxID=91347 RepID=A0AAJ1JGA3_PROST|nr:MULTISPECIES: amino acid aminotransferase [Providencia]MQC11984.1 aspartate/tyrosine/aromatic aminotransferase [Morganella morganii]AFH93456.1 aromatic amino acid aminotransferase [Providencia stuartii MRSN 2154]AIN63057.1 aromatic-amino-acid aminotransferase [Providencia stuartii]AMG68167.1 aspartate/tyrosine/aromatic aminotransferase [Providencia stuartii]APG51444.1 aromatic amino acid aminotransferase [Providencia stuartii]